MSAKVGAKLGSQSDFKSQKELSCFCKKESWQVISADVAQLLFCTLKETIKMAGTLNFKELGCSYSEANFKKSPSNLGEGGTLLEDMISVQPFCL